MNTHELRALKESIEKSIAVIGDRPTDPGFERDMYDQLLRMREMLRGIRPELFTD